MYPFFTYSLQDRNLKIIFTLINALLEIIFRMPPFHRVDMSLYESTQESSHRYLKALCIWSPDLVKKKKATTTKNCVLNIKLKSGVSLQWQEVAQG